VKIKKRHCSRSTRIPSCACNGHPTVECKQIVHLYPWTWHCAEVCLSSRFLLQKHLRPADTAFLRGYTSYRYDHVAGDRAISGTAISFSRQRTFLCGSTAKHYAWCCCTVINGGPQVYNLQYVPPAPQHCYIGRPPRVTLPPVCSSFAAESLQCMAPPWAVCMRTKWDGW
jgi:hypothetical protein